MQIFNFWVIISILTWRVLKLVSLLLASAQTYGDIWAKLGLKEVCCINTFNFKAVAIRFISTFIQTPETIAATEAGRAAVRAERTPYWDPFFGLYGVFTNEEELEKIKLEFGLSEVTIREHVETPQQDVW